MRTLTHAEVYPDCSKRHPQPESGNLQVLVGNSRICGVYLGTQTRDSTGSTLGIHLLSTINKQTPKSPNQNPQRSSSPSLAAAGRAICQGAQEPSGSDLGLSFRVYRAQILQN